MNNSSRVVKHFYVTATFPSGRTVSGRCNALFGGGSGERLPTIAISREEDSRYVTHVTIAQTESISVVPVYEANSEENLSGSNSFVTEPFTFSFQHLPTCDDFFKECEMLKEKYLGGRISMSLLNHMLEELKRGLIAKIDLSATYNKLGK